MTPDEPTVENRTATSTNTSPSDDLTRFQVDLLTVIAGFDADRYTCEQYDQPHGLAIKRVLDTSYGNEVHHGRLYPNLDTLIHKGFVEKTQRDRRTNAYQLTPAGDQYLRRRAQWLTGCLTPDAGPDSSNAADDSIALPDEVSPEDVEQAAESCGALGEVADQLGLEPGRTRVVLHHLGYYELVRDVVNRPGGDR